MRASFVDALSQTVTNLTIMKRNTFHSHSGKQNYFMLSV